MEIMGYTGTIKKCDRCGEPFAEMKGHIKITKCLRCRIEIGREKMAAAREQKQTLKPKTKYKHKLNRAANKSSLTPADLHYIYKPKRVPYNLL